jgi:tubulin polyglutamylase TTLL6/13
MAKKNKWYMLTEPIGNLNFDLCWTDNHVKQDLFARMQPHQKINHFPGITDS